MNELDQVHECFINAMNALDECENVQTSYQELLQSKMYDYMLERAYSWDSTKNLFLERLISWCRNSLYYLAI